MDEPDRLLAIAALAEPDRALEAWRRWRDTVPQAEASGLLVWAGGYVGRNLRRRGVHDPYLAGIARYNFLANNRRVVAALPAIRILTSRFAVSPIKSFGLSEASSARSARPLADFDFYVPGDQLSEVRRALTEAGFRAQLDVDDREFERRIRPHRSSWNYLDGDGTDLDVHWRLFDHLDERANARLVARNSRSDESEFGPIERLSTELAALVIATHHLMEPSSQSRLFDFADLLSGADLGALTRLAREADLRRELRDAVADLRDLVGDLDLPYLRELEALTRRRMLRRSYGATYPVPPGLDLARPRLVEPDSWSRPGAARLWRGLGRPDWLERRLVARAPLSAADADPRPPDDYPLGGGRLGPGWLHRYPVDRYRWANVPDARLVFDGVSGATRLRVVLDDTTWPRSPVPRIRVLVNGRLVGHCDRSDHAFEFDLPPHGDTLEVSLRPAGFRRFLDPGIHVRWFRFLAPVRAVEVL